MKPNFLLQDSSILASTYAKADVNFTHGAGCRLFDASGKEYLDFASGIAVNPLGYSHPAIVKAIKEQSEKFLHISNLYPNEPQIKLAQKILSLTKFGKEKGKAFFCNSGTEANEAAIKFTRKYFFSKGEKREEIITFVNSFHGRTYGALSATGQEKLKAGFGPMLPGFKHVEWNNAEALAKAVSKNTAAIMLEPIAAEGGILLPSKKFIETINKLKKQTGCLVIADEIQTGLGRCGAISCSELFGINANITTWAKAIGGGLPLGMVLMEAHIAECLKPGDHGTTFGGNPVACSAGLAALEIISKPKFLANINERSEQLKAGLKKFGNVRGHGLLLGIECEKQPADIIATCREQGLLILRAGTNVLRFLPPLIITKSDVKKMLGILKNALLSVILAISCLLSHTNGYAQNFPVVLGAALEVGSDVGIARITPFAGVWVNELGFARLGISTGSQKEDSDGIILNETKRFDFSAQIGFSAIGPERPYIMGSYVRSKAYSLNSDAVWNEWGLGIGHRFSLSPAAAILMEAEHRWIAEHYDRIQKANVSGRRLQMNLGFTAHVL